MKNHPDKEFAHFIIKGISEGFRIGFVQQKAPRTSARRNMASAYEHPHVIDEYLQTECDARRVIGPLPKGLDIVEDVHISSFGVIPKKNKPGKWRLILDLSHPEGGSVNDGIPAATCSLSYISIDDIASVVFQFGRGALLAKSDVKNAYRQVPVHPDDRWLLGMQWQGRTYVDAALPFGLRSAPLIFTAIADALEWIVRQRGVSHIYHYIDDFILIGPPASAICQQNFVTFQAACKEVGLILATEKSEGPATCLTILGIEIDSMAMEIRLPQEKLKRLRDCLNLWHGKKSGERVALESLVGLLQHASKVVHPGRTFVRRLYDLLAATSHYRPHYSIRLNRECQADIEWWCSFLLSWNGVSILREFRASDPDIEIYSDASGSWGCGALWGTQWFQLEWGDLPVAHESIAAKELLPVLIACIVWGKDWEGLSIRCYSDNQAAVCVLNQRRAKDPLLSHMLRCLFFVSAKFQFDLSAQHIPGTVNTAADALSRNNLPLFFSQIPRAASTPAFLPLPLVMGLSQSHPNWNSKEWINWFNSILNML